jgi:hypothetical protein
LDNSLRQMAFLHRASGEPYHRHDLRAAAGLGGHAGEQAQHVADQAPSLPAATQIRVSRI